MHINIALMQVAILTPTIGWKILVTKRLVQIEISLKTTESVSANWDQLKWECILDLIAN